MNKQNIIKKVIAKLNEKLIASEKKITPEEIKPGVAGWITPDKTIVKLDPDKEHSDWLRDHTNLVQEHNKKLIKPSPIFNQTLMPLAFSKGWVRFFGGKHRAIQVLEFDVPSFNDKDLIFEGDTDKLNIVKNILKKNGYPWEHVWFNGTKYDLTDFMKQKKLVNRDYVNEIDPSDREE